MVASTRRETRFRAGCDLPRIFIRAFEYRENWITNTINRYELWTAKCLLRCRWRNLFKVVTPRLHENLHSSGSTGIRWLPYYVFMLLISFKNYFL